MVTKVEIIPAKDDSVPTNPEKKVGNFPDHRKPFGRKLMAFSKSRQFFTKANTSNIYLSSNCRIDLRYSAADDVLK